MTFTAQACQALKVLIDRIEELDNPGDEGIGMTDPAVTEAKKTLEYLRSEGCFSDPGEAS